MLPDLFDSSLVGWLVLAAVPLVLATCTAFTKIGIVLSALRIGLGAEALLPFGIIIALAVLLSAIVMAPVAIALGEGVVASGGLEALLSAPLPTWVEVLRPMSDFLAANSSDAERSFYAGLQNTALTDPRTLVPAFLTTELTEALTMAVLLIVPFLLVDLIVAQILTLVDLAQVSPQTFALPAKILLFVYAGGWDLIVSALVEGYW